jgi:hypothetical protein
MEEFKIVIDKKIVDEYCEYYFKKYPKRKVAPIDKPFPVSLNRFTAMKRMMQNALKQKYKEFSVWLASYYSIANLNIDKAVMTFTFYFPDHRRRDFDNLCLSPKFYNDGWVDAKVFVDDSGDHIMLRFNEFEYDKLNPRLEIDVKWGDENGERKG